MILSVGQLLEAGINVYASRGRDRDKRCLEFPDRARAAMEVRGKSFYIRGRIVVSSAAHQAYVAPVDADMGVKSAAATAASAASTAASASSASAASSAAPAPSATSTAAATTAVAAGPGDICWA